MRVGRPPMKSALVEGLEGEAREKARLRAMLETLSGERTLEEACEALDLSRSRFCELRERALQAALDGLIPGVPGRKPKVREVEASEVDKLEREVEYLREELKIAWVRTELAMTMPKSLRAPKPGKAWHHAASFGSRSRATTRGSRS